MSTDCPGDILSSPFVITGGQIEIQLIRVSSLVDCDSYVGPLIAYHSADIT